MNKKIIAIRSAKGPYFEIGINDSGYYLKNKYTEIPNEFEMYDIKIIKEMFDKACEAVATGVPIDYVSWNDADGVRVIYDDNSSQLFRSQNDNDQIKRISSIAGKISEYSDIVDCNWSNDAKEMLTLDDLRRICKEGIANPNEIYRIIDKLNPDHDGIEYDLYGGGIKETVLGIAHGYILSWNYDKTINHTGHYKFAEVMKKNGVRIMYPPEKKEVPIEFTTEVFSKFDKKWALLTAGTKEKFNSMTISWGGLGTLWGKPVVTAYVRPSRYTHDFMENSDLFTISFYTDEQKKILEEFGSKSGRDIDKMKYPGMIAIEVDDAITFSQADVTLICKKIYRQRLTKENMSFDVCQTFYQDDDYHDMYIGEVVRIVG